MSPRRYVIRTHDPKRLAWLLAGVGALLLLAGWALFAGGRLQADADRRAARTAESAVARLAADNDDLRARLAVAERSGQVDIQAHDDLRGSLTALNDEILGLRQELAFYRSIVSPADARRGVRVHDLEVRTGAAGARYRLMLIQAMQHDRQAEGRARLTVVGTDADGPSRLPVVADGLAYDFRYFQSFDGDILLPQGFVPSHVEVTLDPRNARDGVVEQVFDWPGAVNTGG